MDCGCNDYGYGGYGGYGGICRPDIPYPQISAESVPSLISNLTYSLYGSITKSVSNGQITWNIPCDPNQTAAIAGIPRNVGEGLLCYIIRAFSLINTGSAAPTFTTVTAANYIANQTISTSANIGAYSYGTLTFNDTNVVSSYSASVNGYVQSVLQNSSNGTGASADFIVTNNAGTINNYYGDFGINSSTYSGTGGFNLANGVFLISQGGDLSVGTTSNNNLHLITNNSTTDAVTINTSNAVAFGGSYGTSGQILTSSGTAGAPTWSTNLAGNAATATSATTASNLALGSAGQIPYQTGSGTTTFLSAGSASSVLVMNNVGNAPTWTTLNTPAYVRLLTNGTAITTIANFFPSTYALVSAGVYEIEANLGFVTVGAGTAAYTFYGSVASGLAGINAYFTQTNSAGNATAATDITGGIISQTAATTYAFGATPSLTAASHNVFIKSTILNGSAANTISIYATFTGTSLTPQSQSYFKITRIA